MKPSMSLNYWTCGWTKSCEVNNSLVTDNEAVGLTRQAQYLFTWLFLTDLAGNNSLPFNFGVITSLLAVVVVLITEKLPRSTTLQGYFPPWCSYRNVFHTSNTILWLCLSRLLSFVSTIAKSKVVSCEWAEMPVVEPARGHTATTEKIIKYRIASVVEH